VKGLMLEGRKEEERKKRREGEIHICGVLST
jgi:hypothetical protein